MTDPNETRRAEAKALVEWLVREAKAGRVQWADLQHRLEFPDQMRLLIDQLVEQDGNERPGIPRQVLSYRQRLDTEPELAGGELASAYYPHYRAIF